MTNIFIKIFARGFYQAHAGLFLFAFLVMIGAVEPGQLFSYHKLLMLAFITSPVMMVVVFAIWLIYCIKTWHYTIGQLFAVNQQFLFYAATAYNRKQQLRAWLHTQLAMLAPVAVYGVVAIVVGVWHHYYLGPLAIFIYLAILTLTGALICTTLLNRQLDGSSQSLFLRWSANWRKPFFSLFIYQVFDKLKVRYITTKAISYLIVNAIFWMFADVRGDIRVAAIAMLAIAAAHTMLIFEERRFEEINLAFARGLPYSRLQLFGGFALVYLALLLPETIWLLSRFPLLTAFRLVLFGLGLLLLFHSLLYWMGLNMDRYLQYILGIFMAAFILILFGQIIGLILLSTAAAFLTFYFNYYRTFAVEGPS